MEVIDYRLKVENRSDKKNMVFLKDRRGTLGWTSVDANTKRSFPLLNLSWSDVLIDELDTLIVYWVDYEWYGGGKPLQVINDSTALKTTNYTRSDLDSLNWTVEYP
jgi:hypothetical protein